MNINASIADIKILTADYKGPRSADGRPHVSDDLLKRMSNVSAEEAWGTLHALKYHNQFASGFIQTHPGTILVGRAVTTQFIPHRPDFHDLVEKQGLGEGRIGGQNSWVIDMLELGDVLVVEMFGKVRDGTFIGDNLGTSIERRTKAGAVFDCGVRDHRGLSRLQQVNFFCRGIDPSAIAGVTLAGVNMPVRIGETTVLPGDVVLGTHAGIVFVPAHLAQEVVEAAENIGERDTFGHLRLRQGRYTPGEIDRAWSNEIEADYKTWLSAGKPAA